MIALISCNTLLHNPLTQQDINSVGKQPVKATLVVCPLIVLYQWQEHLALHAPSLSVLVYHSSVQGYTELLKVLQIVCFPMNITFATSILIHIQ